MTTTQAPALDYTPSTRIKWYRTKVDRETMSKLIKRSDLKGLAQALPHLLLILVTGSVSYWAFLNHHWLILLPTMFLHGCFVNFWGLGGAGHELCHKSVFRSAWLNALFLRLSAFLTWYNYPWFMASHVRHHQYTLHQPDDLEVVLPGKFNWKSLIHSVCYPPSIYHVLKYNLRIIRGRYAGEWEQRLTQNDAPLRREMRNWSLALVLTHLALIVTFIATGHAFLILLVNFAFFYGGTINFFMGLPQHYGLVDKIPDFRLCCRTFVANPFFNWLYWKMNYHTEHHMYPGVPCYNLHKLRKVIDHDMPPAKSLLGTWKEIVAIRRKQDEDPNYAYIQTLPPTATPAQITAPTPGPTPAPASNPSE